MAGWQGATAIVTGAGSGIGLALAEAMIGRGAEVWLTDINEEAVRAAADRLGEKAHAERLDVRDAKAVQDIVDRVAGDRGKLDYMFNNAGIGIGGESHEIVVEHYDRIIDINIRGVTNGVAAAYPLMVKQGSGHIVNTASAAGLLPVPLLSPYAMTKHAVVGLTVSMRIEAENYGVRVSALCPTAIETPLLDAENPEDLHRPWRPDIRSFLTRVGGAPYPVDAFANYSLDRIERNTGLIIAPARARLGVFLYRMVPGVMAGVAKQSMNAEIAKRPKDK